MCGILGPKSTNGSLFMQEKMYQNFMLGLQTMSTLGESSALDVSGGPPRAPGRDEVGLFKRSGRSAVRMVFTDQITAFSLAAIDSGYGCSDRT